MVFKRKTLCGNEQTMKNEIEIMQSGARITKKSHAGDGQESKWEIPVNTQLTLPPGRVNVLAMKSILKIFALIGAASLLQFSTVAQTSAPVVTAAATVSEVHANTAIIPVPRSGGITNRQNLVLRRARENPGNYDIEFIGDSITEGWEGPGKNVWQEFYGNRKVINLGVGGDRTQHVLWRFQQGQLDGIKARVAVVMIGTNNSNEDDNTEADILEGVTAIVNQIRARQPETKVLLLGIFPRGKTFSAQRGKILEVNEALARLDDGKHIFYLDFGSQFIENDGSISSSIMRDALHPNEAGYRIWAEAMEPKLKELLAD
jgi:lysophospholipase L1-like esterase